MGHRMVIVGAGEAGARAALALRELDFRGTVTLLGEEAHLPYERPPLSKEILTADGAAQPKTIAGAGRMDALGIDCITHAEVQGIDRHGKTVHLSDRRTIPYDKLLLATGAAPRRIVFPGEADHHCVTLRRFEDAVRLRRYFEPGATVAIIGGGFIGLELAASAVKRGAKVAIIEGQQRILSRGVSAEIARTVALRHIAAGVEIACGIQVAAIEDREGRAVVRLTNSREISADVVVLGVGAVPRTALAAAADLEIENGIAVDSRLRTNDASIFAAGDCCSFPLSIYDNRRFRLEAWRNAQYQGALAARNMLGANDEISTVPWFWSDQHELTLQVAGLIDQGQTSIRRDVGSDAFLEFYLDAAGRLVAACGIGPGNIVARDIRLAEMLIAKRARPRPSDLAAAEVKLKSLLAA